LPHDEGNNMTVGYAVLRIRARIVAVAIAGAVATLAMAADVHAQAPLRDRRAERPFHPFRHRYAPPEAVTHPAPASAAQPAPIMRTASSPEEFREHQRDGHMTPDERRLLRQHIEDAVRELYKR
jgi:hypothetical protein